MLHRPPAIVFLAACFFALLALSPGITAAPATPGEPYLVLNTSPGHAREIVDLDGSPVFIVDFVDREELWRAEGTLPDTLKLTTVTVPNIGNNLMEELTVVGHQVFFGTSGSGTGVGAYKLWKTDGSVAGTVLVKDLAPGGIFYSPLKHLTNVDGTLFFDGRDTFTYYKPWRSDGTADGTLRLGNQDVYDEQGTRFAGAGGRFYFLIDLNASGLSDNRTNLGVSDGTPVGTGTLRPDLYLPWWTQFATVSAVLGDHLYFNAKTASGPYGLWQTDGTANGTTLVFPSFASGPTNVDGTLYFGATAAGNGTELWKSDGTPGGTVFVKDINPAGDSGPGRFTGHKGIVYFVASTAAAGSELWRTDGTAAGTWLVKDIRPGDKGSSINMLTSAGDRLYFAASDGTHGSELWVSDGTEGGTHMVRDFSPGSGSGLSGLLTLSGNRLYFSVYGDSLWALDLPVTTHTYLPVLLR